MPSPIALHYCNHDVIDHLVAMIGETHRDELPNLSHLVILLPEMDAAPRLRQQLLSAAEKAGHSALLGPTIIRLQDWINQVPLPGPTIISDQVRELLMAQALKGHRHLYGEGNPWSLADSLLTLFDELSLSHTRLPQSLEQFMQDLAEGYGLPSTPPQALGVEARLVHTLWHAWQKQLGDNQWLDRPTAYLARLGKSLELPLPKHLYLCGLPDLAPAELGWLQAVAEKTSLHWLIEGQSIDGDTAVHPARPLQQLQQTLGVTFSGEQLAPHNDHQAVLDDIYHGFSHHDAPAFQQRAQQLGEDYTHSPLIARMNTYAAHGNEDEAKAVDLTVRRWLLEGRGPVAIVTENRRLARRVRALLDRAGINVHDRGGWVLSTTNAATALERWMQCVEEEFPYLALLDLLKSPFVSLTTQRDEQRDATMHFEQDLVRHEQVFRGLSAYRNAMTSRQRRLGAAPIAAYDTLRSILDLLEQAAAPLLSLRSQPQSPSRWLDALFESLSLLGLEQSWGGDDAGIRILEELSRLQQAAITEHETLEWTEFRTWVGRRLERCLFRPPVERGAVQLLDLEQSLLGQFDALIIAGAEREYLPGSGLNQPFFNDAVRHQLNLKTTEQLHSRRFYLYRRLLQAANQLLITYRTEQDGEPVPISPWVEVLNTCHQQAWHTSLHDHQLEKLLLQERYEVTVASQPLPPPQQQPAPVTPEDRLPTVLSASSYQQLVDCPYRFFAARLLALSAPEPIREALSKSEYGEIVHRCLQAFHESIKGMPAPFTQPLTKTHREAAIEHLNRLSEQVFAAVIQQNYRHRGWLKMWRDLIPTYIDWAINRYETWRVHRTEQHLEQPDASGWTLQGRLDRIDQHESAHAIIDYKTGSTPDTDDIESGEAVQLPFYALLADGTDDLNIEQVEYLRLNRNRFGNVAALADEQLASLIDAHRNRLRELHALLHSGAQLPANGDNITCSYCDFEGLCRKESWSSFEQDQDPK